MLNPICEKRFFDFIKERQNIWYRRNILKQEPFWTEDKILQKYKFCNVFRELDSGTTVMYNALKDCEPHTQFFNVIIYRVFNNKLLFEDSILPVSPINFDRKDFVRSLEEFRDKYKVLFNTAYLTSQHSFKKDIPEEIGVKHIQFSYSLEEIALNIEDTVSQLYHNDNPLYVFNKLNEFKLVGEFLGYQFVLDLCQLGFLGYTENDFYIIGPGAQTGVGVLLELPDSKLPSIRECEDVLEYLYDRQNLFLDNNEWMSITFSDSVSYPFLSRSAIEFCLCEFRKYNNYQLGIGRKRIYNYEKKTI